MSDLYAMYLRKSRTDADAERMGVDTLGRHEQILTAYAAEHNLKIGKVYREVVSGDSIAGREQMQQLLEDVGNGFWRGVLVVEVERLARGDTIDQGIIAQTFKYSDTKIITPYKVYDPNDEFDEEFFEYGLFQSRREYKAINRRQQRGTVKAIEEGKWTYNRTPYGYERYKLPDQKGYSLRIIPEEADVVRLIFRTYATEAVGCTTIADRLNQADTPAPDGIWRFGTVKNILTNPVYIGKVKRGARGCVKKIVDGKLVTTRPRNKEYKICDGLHEPIIDNDTFDRVQERFATHISKPVAASRQIRNPLAGLLYCSMCGRKMVRRPQDRCRTMMICTTKGCPNISSYEYAIEHRVISFLEDYLDELKTGDAKETESSPAAKLLQNSIDAFDRELLNLNSQLDKAYNLVEQGVYTPEVFLQRSQVLNTAIDDTNKKRRNMERKLQREQRIRNNKSILIPKIENALAIYDSASIPERNALLTDIIERIDYTKTERSKVGGPYDNFSITVKPRIPL